VIHEDKGLSGTRERVWLYLEEMTARVYGQHELTTPAWCQSGLFDG